MLRGGHISRITYPHLLLMKCASSGHADGIKLANRDEFILLVNSISRTEWSELSQIEALPAFK